MRKKNDGKYKTNVCYFNNLCVVLVMYLFLDETFDFESVYGIKYFDYNCIRITKFKRIVL